MCLTQPRRRVHRDDEAAWRAGELRGDGRLVIEPRERPAGCPAEDSGNFAEPGVDEIPDAGNERQRRQAERRGDERVGVLLPCAGPDRFRAGFGGQPGDPLAVQRVDQDPVRPLGGLRPLVRPPAVSCGERVADVGDEHAVDVEEQKRPARGGLAADEAPAELAVPRPPAGFLVEHVGAAPVELRVVVADLSVDAAVLHHAGAVPASVGAWLASGVVVLDGFDVIACGEVAHRICWLVIVMISFQGVRASRSATRSQSSISA
jgi:hypothetical protein